MSDDVLDMPRGASVWERDMYAYLASHGKREGKLLEEYLDMVEHTESKALRYVIGLLVADERRHHQQFADLAQSLKALAELGAEEPSIPQPDFQREGREAVLDFTRRLIANEESDYAELKRLRKQLKDVEHTTLWTLLVETMQIDTEKHLAMLRFIEQRVKERS